MVLYLVQHGKSLAKGDDPQRPLSIEGIEETQKIARIARDSGIAVAAIRHSGKLRAKQTAEILATALLVNDVSVMEDLKPLDDVKIIACEVSKYEEYMLVGHLPYMERLVSFLITNNQDRRIVCFQNSGIVCLENSENIWHISWTLFPNLISNSMTKN